MAHVTGKLGLIFKKTIFEHLGWNPLSCLKEPKVENPLEQWCIGKTCPNYVKKRHNTITPLRLRSFIVCKVFLL